MASFKRQEILTKYSENIYRDLMNEDNFCEDFWGLLERFSCADLQRLEKRNHSKYMYKKDRTLVTCRYCQCLLRHTRMDRHVQHTCNRNRTYSDIPICKCTKMCSDCHIDHVQKHYHTKTLTYLFHG